MSSISSAAWRVPDWRITGRRVKYLRRRVLTKHPFPPRLADMEFRTPSVSGKYYGVVISGGAFYGYVQHNRQVGTRGVRLRVQLPAKMAFSMYLSLKQRKLI